MNLSRWDSRSRNGALHPRIPSFIPRSVSWFAPRRESLEEERAGRIRERKLERILELGDRRNEIRLISIIAGPCGQLHSREGTRMDTRSGSLFVARRETRVRFANSSPRKKRAFGLLLLSTAGHASLWATDRNRSKNTLQWHSRGVSNGEIWIHTETEFTIISGRSTFDGPWMIGGE